MNSAWSVASIAPGFMAYEVLFSVVEKFAVSVVSVG